MYMDVMCAEVDELCGCAHVSGIVFECFVVLNPQTPTRKLHEGRLATLVDFLGIGKVGRLRNHKCIVQTKW